MCENRHSKGKENLRSAVDSTKEKSRPVCATHGREADSASGERKSNCTETGQATVKNGTVDLSSELANKEFKARERKSKSTKSCTTGAHTRR
jgi:hypothetical protein